MQLYYKTVKHKIVDKLKLIGLLYKVALLCIVSTNCKLMLEY